MSATMWQAWLENPTIKMPSLLLLNRSCLKYKENLHSCSTPFRSQRLLVPFSEVLSEAAFQEKDVGDAIFLLPCRRSPVPNALSEDTWNKLRFFTLHTVVLKNSFPKINLPKTLWTWRNPTQLDSIRPNFSKKKTQRVYFSIWILLKATV